jgi:hypothetical protein
VPASDRLLNPQANPSNPSGGRRSGAGGGSGRGTQFIGAGAPARRLSAGKFIGIKGASKQGSGGGTADPDRGIFLL